MIAAQLRFGLRLSLCGLLACGADDAASEPSGSTGAEPSQSSTAVATETGQGSGAVDDGSSTSDGGSDSSTTSACTPMGDTAESTPVTLATADGKTLAAVLSAPDVGTCLPAVVLVHQFGLNQSQWSDQLAAFVERGYVTLTIDLRGHGDSDSADGDLTELLTDPDQAPLDMEAAIAYLQAHEAVDAGRIAVVGTSIGANLAIVAATQHDVAAAVAISARATPVESLLGGAAVSVGPLLCMAGASDGGGDQAASCATFEGFSSGPAESIILADTAAHGVEIVDMFPETVPTILTFLDENL